MPKRRRMAGGKGVTFATTDDARQQTDTPADTPDHVNIVNLAAQTKLLACQYWHLLNDTNDPEPTYARQPGVADARSRPGPPGPGRACGSASAN